MSGRPRSLTTKKNKAVKKINQKKTQFENYNISKGISLKIINVHVEKAKIDIYGNYIYKLENESHYEVDVELNFTDSEYIKTRDIPSSDKGLIFKQHIEPFSHKKSISSTTELENINKSDSLLAQSELSKGKICEIEYLINFNVKSKFKFDINFPSLEKQKELIDNDMKIIFNNLQDCEKYLKNIAYEKLESGKIIDIFNKYQIKSFVDWEFSPNLLTEMQISIQEYQLSINSNQKHRVLKSEIEKAQDKRMIAVHWRKIESLIPPENKQICSNEDIYPLDIIYGLIINCNLICILAHLAEYPSLIERLIEDTNITPNGMYNIKLFDKGAWHKIYIDNLIPCFPQSFPIYSYSKNSCWVMLIEKALAKLMGGYDKLKSMEIFRIYKCLTGLPIISINVDSVDDDKASEVFDKLEEASSKGYIISAYADSSHYNFSNNNFQYDTFFNKNYTYPVIAAVRSGDYQMIILRNIWKESEFQGDYYMNSSKLPQDVVKYFEKYQEKTIIIMNPIEFLHYFNNITIIYSDNFYELSLRSKFSRCQDKVETDLESIISMHYYELVVTKKTQIKICLELNQDEFFADKYISNKMDMSIGILLKDPSKEKWVKYFHQDFINDKQVLIDVKLKPGRYVVIPRTMGLCMKKNKNSYNQYFSAYSLDGKYLNMEVLSNIFEEIFYSNDYDCSGELSFKELEKIINRLNGQLDIDEYNSITRKYCLYSDTITLKAFINLMRDIFILKKDNHIAEFLKNLGYDKNLYPYLNRFYSINFYSNKPVRIQSRFNLLENWDRIFCNAVLEEIMCDEGDSEEPENEDEDRGEDNRNQNNHIINSKTNDKDTTLISYISQDKKSYLLGVRNSSKKGMKEVAFDASKCLNVYHSTNVPKFSKFVKGSSVEFFMYVVDDGCDKENHNRHDKIIEINATKLNKKK